MTEEALRRIQPDVQLDEAELLGAFDAKRDLIYATGTKVYARDRKAFYNLVGSDF